MIVESCSCRDCCCRRLFCRLLYLCQASFAWQNVPKHAHTHHRVAEFSVQEKGTRGTIIMSSHVSFNTLLTHKLAQVSMLRHHSHIYIRTLLMTHPSTVRYRNSLRRLFSGIRALTYSMTGRTNKTTKTMVKMQMRPTRMPTTNMLVAVVVVAPCSDSILLKVGGCVRAGSKGYS